MGISLHLIDTFHVVVEAGTVTEAAKRLGRTQPAITARIKQLESELGVALFRREGRRLELTPTGRLAAERARKVVIAADAFAEQVLATAHKPGGVLKVGALPTVSSYRVTPLLPALAKQHPGMQIELSLKNVGPMLDQLRSGHLDAVLSVGDPNSIDLDHEEIDTISPVAVFERKSAPPEGPVSPKQLRTQSYVAFARDRVGDPFFDQVANFAARHQLLRQSRIRVGHIESIKSLVLAGAGYAILPDYVVTERGLVVRPIRGFAPQFPLVFSRRPPREGSENTERLLTLLRGALEQ